jgi:hypothetical protein
MHRCCGVFILSLALLASCSSKGPSGPNMSGSDGGPSSSPAPPAPPVAPDLPSDFVAILLDVPVEAIPGVTLQLVYDAARDDAIARWGECLGRVHACYKTNSGPVTQCIVTGIEKCADDTGGKGCCPPSCINSYKSLHDSGASEEDAIERSFIAGDCVTGFSALAGGS